MGFCVACTLRLGRGCEIYVQYSECMYICAGIKNIAEPEVQKVPVSNGFDAPKTNIMSCVRVH